MAQQIDSREAKISGGLAVQEGDNIEDEEDVGEGVLGLGSASEQTRGGAEVLWVDGGEAGDAPTPVMSSCLGRPWWLQGGDGAGRSCPPGWRRRRKREGEGETLGRGCWLKRRGEDGATSASVKLTARARALCLWNRDGDATGQVAVNRVGPGGLRWICY